MIACFFSRLISKPNLDATRPKSSPVLRLPDFFLVVQNSRGKGSDLQPLHQNHTVKICACGQLRVNFAFNFVPYVSRALNKPLNMQKGFLLKKPAGHKQEGDIPKKQIPPVEKEEEDDDDDDGEEGDDEAEDEQIDPEVLRTEEQIYFRDTALAYGMSEEDVRKKTKLPLSNKGAIFLLQVNPFLSFLSRHVLRPLRSRFTFD